MTRSISTSMASILERLELERPTVITHDMLTKMLHDESIKTPARIFAARLREKGWLLPTPTRGVWEFVPASSAGAFSSNDPLLPIRSHISKHGNISIGLTFQTGAWIHGVADRVPIHLEVATGNTRTMRLLPEGVASSVFSPHLSYNELKGVPVLAPESIIVHMAAKPNAVRSWQSALEWLPELASLLKATSLYEEISERSSTVIARTGYLIQGMRPDIAAELLKEYKPKNKTWFGSRAPLIRHDNKWLIADTILPFDPVKIRGVMK